MERITQWYIYAVTGDDGSSFFFQIFPKKNIPSCKSFSRQIHFKGKWSLNSSTESKDLWNPSDKRWHPNCIVHEKVHAEHTVSLVGSYFDISIRWTFSLQAKHAKINFLFCFDFWIQIATCCSMSHTFESRESECYNSFYLFLLPIFLSLLINRSAKSLCF